MGWLLANWDNHSFQDAHPDNAVAAYERKWTLIKQMIVFF